MSPLAAILPRDFIQFIEVLNDEKVEYLIIGGIAVGFHGHVRATKDLDVFVRATRDRAHDRQKGSDQEQEGQRSTSRSSGRRCALRHLKKACDQAKAIGLR
jgi:hypothetical protein